jgi:hypothetical protein
MKNIVNISSEFFSNAGKRFVQDLGLLRDQLILQNSKRLTELLTENGLDGFSVLGNVTAHLLRFCHNFRAEILEFAGDGFNHSLNLQPHLFVKLARFFLLRVKLVCELIQKSFQLKVFRIRKVSFETSCSDTFFSQILWIPKNNALRISGLSDLNLLFDFLARGHGSAGHNSLVGVGPKKFVQINLLVCFVRSSMYMVRNVFLSINTDKKTFLTMNMLPEVSTLPI